MTMSDSAKTPSRVVQFAVLTVGIFAISSGSILIRLAQNESVPSLVIAFWRMMLSALMLLPFALAGRRQELSGMGREKWGLAVLSGMLLGLHFATWTSSLAFTSITSSTVLVATAPLWVGLAAPFLLNEPLSRGLKLGIGLAIMGTVVVSMGAVVGLENGRVALNLAGPADGNQALLGNALALIGGIAVAGYMIIGRSTWSAGKICWATV
jgi:drug/metabolite transporter (DMT)-like permease